jgi:phenylalanyl-tRNA synthetase beta chain
VLQAGKEPTGAVGEVHPAVLERFEVAERVAILELNLDEVLGREPKPAAWSPVSRMPSSDLDLAFVLPEEIPAERLEKAIRQGAGKLLDDITLFDVYRGGSLGADRRSLAYRLRLQSPDRNLTDADVAEIRRSVQTATRKLGAELRG